MKPKKPHEPGNREICQKVEQAIAALELGNITIIADRHNQLAMDFLGASDMDEVLDWVAVFLPEIKDAGPVQCFVGKYANPCSHKGFDDLLLYPFHWDSPSRKARVYLKFGIRTETSGTGKTYIYCHLDCHEDN